jgi:uncharacterized delta-60 repeat protein
MMRSAIILITLIFTAFSFVALAAPGDLDTTFAGGYFVTDISQNTSMSAFTQMAIKPNGKIVLAANISQLSGTQITLYRLNADATRDTSFGVGGQFTIPTVSGRFFDWDHANAMVLQPDGKILIMGRSAAGCVVSRVNSNGSVDTSFGGTGHVITASNHTCGAINLQADGKIIVAGLFLQPSPSMSSGWFMARFNSDGSFDSGFGPGGIWNSDADQFKYGTVGNVLIQPDGNILLCASHDLTKRFSLMRFNALGGIDFSFGAAGLAMMPPVASFSDTAADVKMQADGKIVFVGNRSAGLGFKMARMNTDGTPDLAFGTGGVVILTGPVLSTFNVAVMAIQEDGKIVAGGYVTTAPNKIDFAVVRFNANGSVDSAKLVSRSKTRDLSLVKRESVLDGMWGSGGLATAGTPDGNENITGLAVDAVGRVVTAGHSFILLPGNTAASDVAMARFLSDAAPLANIYGTIKTADGIPIKNVSVVLSEGGLSQPVYALTNQFGLYFFSNLPVTENYSVSISSKRFSFNADQQVFILLHDEPAIDFTAQP